VLLLLAPEHEDLGPVVGVVEGAVLVEDQADPAGVRPVRVPESCRGVQLMLGNLKLSGALNILKYRNRF
jgi:hypothetical protein